MAKRLKIVLIFLLFMFAFNFYFLSRYKSGHTDVTRISLFSDISRHQLLVYATPEHAIGTDFEQPVVARTVADRYVFEPGENIRKFSIYVGTETERTIIKDLRAEYSNGEYETIDLSEFTTNGITVLDRADHVSMVFSSIPNGHFEMRKARLSNSEFISCEIIIVIIAILMSLLTMLSFPDFLNYVFKMADLKSIGVGCFFASVFLPHPVFNVIFILSSALVIWDFKWRTFIANRTGLLFLSYFVLFIFNAFAISGKFNGAFFETMLPFIFLPVYFACVPRADYLKAFITASFLLTGYLLATSAIETSVYRNINYFSFDAFSKHLHPVYFSYLLFFSLACLESTSEQGINKVTTRIMLLTGLVCCGSKLIILLCVLFYGIRLVRKRLLLGLGAVILLVGAAMLFAPTKKRFAEVFKVANLSILADHPIKSIHDPRLNGLTLRLILWQESLRGSGSLKDMFFGKGTDKRADEILQDRLTKRGLETGHAKYDPHNQYIATYYKMGLAGLIILMLIFADCVYVSIKKNKPLLLTAVVLFCTAMLTESVLQRVVGIYFFICILLLISGSTNDPIYQPENSHTGNKGNPQ